MDRPPIRSRRARTKMAGRNPAIATLRSSMR
jgi:hypothetical protein